MKRLYSYLLERFTGPFILTFFVSIFVFLMMFLWRYLDELVGKGLESSIITELMFYATISQVPMALPLAVLMASIITFGNLGERFELLAIKSSGVSLLKIMKPLIILNTLITFFAFFIANEVIPITNTKFFALLWSVKEQRPEMIIKEGAFSNDIDGYSIKVNNVDKNNGALLGVMIYNHTEGKGNISVTLADSGFLNISDNKEYMILTLFRGESYTDVQSGGREVRKNYPFRRERFDKEEIIINVKDYNLKRADESLFKSGYKMLKNSQLLPIIDSLKNIYLDREKFATVDISYNNQLNENIQNHFCADSLNKLTISNEKVVNYNFDSIYSTLKADYKTLILNKAQQNAQLNQRKVIQHETELYNKLKWVNRHIIELHRRYTLSLSCIIFFFIGAPLGAIIRKGGFGMPIVIAILLFISYYLVSMVGENVAREGVMKVAESMWFSTFLFLIIGIFITQQAINDSLLLSKEMYGRLINKLNFFKFFQGANAKIESNEHTFPYE